MIRRPWFASTVGALVLVSLVAVMVVFKTATVPYVLEDRLDTTSDASVPDAIQVVDRNGLEAQMQGTDTDDNDGTSIAVSGEGQGSAHDDDVDDDEEEADTAAMEQAERQRQRKEEEEEAAVAQARQHERDEKNAAAEANRKAQAQAAAVAEANRKAQAQAAVAEANRKAQAQAAVAEANRNAQAQAAVAKDAIDKDATSTSVGDGIDGFTMFGQGGKIASVRPTKQIIMYTPLFGQARTGGGNEWMQAMVGGPKSFSFCPIKECTIEFVENHSEAEVHSAAALIFHERDLFARAGQPGRGLPSFAHPPNQPWVLFTQEAPRDNFTPQYANVFNWTWTYRTSSEVWIPYVEQINALKSPVLLPNLIADKMRWRSESNLAPVGMLVLNCQAHNHRLQYVQELMKHIAIDSLGQCEHTRDSITIDGRTISPMRHNYHSASDGVQVSKDVRKAYKFFIAFENNNCLDYVTEKYFNALEGGAIPIVLYGEWYDQFAPLKGRSFIRASDFASPKALAEYIKKVDNDDSLYAEYQEWRSTPIDKLQQHYAQIGRKISVGHCRLCELLHMDPPPPHRSVPDLQAIWSRAHNCPNQHLPPVSKPV